MGEFGPVACTHLLALSRAERMPGKFARTRLGRATTMAQVQIQEVRPTHEKIIDAICAVPRVRNYELARMFGYTEAWLSVIMRSQAFKEALARRRGEVVDPVIVSSIEERINGLASRATDIMLNGLDADPSFDKALAALKAVAPYALEEKAKRTESKVTNYVVAIPPVAPDAKSWLKASARGASDAEVVEEPTGG